MNNLFLLLLSVVTTTGLGGLELLALDTAGAATTEGRGEGEVDVLLGVQADHERRHVDDLLTDTVTNESAKVLPLLGERVAIPDVTLLDQDTSVVDGLGEAKLVDAGLQTTLQEILNVEGQDVIELHAGLIEHTDADQTANQSVTFEQTLGVLLVESEQLTIEATG